MKKVLLLSFFLLAGLRLLLAQTTTSAMSGKISDTKGETLPGTTVLVIYKPTNTSYGVNTNAEGRYTLVNLTPGGPYEVSVTFVGYKTEKYDDVFLKLGETLRLDITLLEESQQLKEVVVTGANQDITEKNGTGTSVGKQQLQTLPTLNRSFSDFTRLTPQSSNNSFAGTNFRYNNITLDGAINNDAIGFSPSLGGISGTANQPGSSTRTNSFSLDAIQQVQVQIAPYDVSLGNFTGGSINAVSRSGTNNLEGSVYTFGRNSAITGKYKGADKVGDGSINSSYYDYQTGFRLGLPLVKDKLFWFTNEEITSNSVPLFFPADAPGYFMNQTLSQLNGGNVPASLASYASSSLADAITQKLSNLSSLYGNMASYNPGATANYSIYSKSTKFFNRIDWVINKNHSLAVRNNSIISDASNLERSTTEFQFGNYDFIQKNSNISTVAEWKSRFGNSISNSLIIGYTDIKDRRDPTGTIFPQVQINGINGSRVLLGTNREAGIFNMRQRTFEFTDNFKFFTGNHTLTLGTHNEFYKIDYVFINSWNGRFDYSSLNNFLLDNPSRMRALYSPTDDTRNTLLNNSPAKFNVFLTSVYAQDEIVKGKLTFTYGVRADLPILPSGPDGLPRSKFPSAVPYGNYGSTFTYNNPSTIGTQYFSQLYVSPRIGFNYDLKGDQRVIIRGGSGLFTGRIPFAWIGYTYVNSGAAFNAMDLNPPKPIAPATGVPIPTDQTQFGTFATAYGSKNRTEIDLLDKNFSLPRMWRSNIAADIQLGNGYKLTLEALFTKTVKDLYIKQINLKDSAAYASYDVNKLQPLYLSAPAAYTTATGNRVSNNFSSVYLITNTDKGYRYQLTAQISKSYPFGLSFMAAYTYGQSKDILNGIRNSPESGWQTNQALNPNNPSLTYSNFDIRHRIVATIQYKKTWQRWGISYLSLIPTFQSGSPFSYGITSSNNLTKNGQQVDLFYVPNISQGENPYHLNASQQQAFNQFIQNDTYLNKRQGQFTERNGARTPWNNQMDLRLMHDFPISNGKKINTLQISFDIINFSNLISKNWGVYYFTPNTINSSVDPGLTIGGRTVSNGVATITGAGYTTPSAKWSVDQFGSRWQAQVGVRYTF
ncbi:MAG: carboxypeptidase regulatory-like domain-containing protein [Bacteroidetes bacterium]|nr:carboxypeptidase regulatory-like domain-containing protein [Bacteroidota bacterium]MBS1540059.1 carboxypeptidase regulatory-like domain-containing protein [Bacteroidota bacterium]